MTAIPSPDADDLATMIDDLLGVISDICPLHDCDLDICADDDPTCPYA